MIEYNLQREKALEKRLIKFAECINLIATEEELKEFTPAMYEDKERRATFLEALDSVDYYNVNIDILAAIFCSFADLYNSDVSFKNFYTDVYHMIERILNNN